jgi:hypothetical protein
LVRKELHYAATAIVAMAMAGSAALAWHHIRTTSIWYDEAITLLTLAGHARPDWSGNIPQFDGSAGFAQILSDLYRFDVHPPLYFWAAAVWRFFAGHSLESIRSLSALFILASIWLLYRTAATFPMRYPAFPAMIYAFSGAAIGYAYTARSYAMAEFLIVLTIYCAQRKSAWTGVVAAACVAVHYFSALCVGPILMVYCGARWDTDRRWSILTGCSFIAVAASLLPLVLVQIGARPDQYAAPASIAAEVKAALTGSFEAGFPSSTVGWLRKAAMMVVAVCAIAGAFRSFRRHVGVAAIAWTAFIAGFFLLEFLTHKSIANMPVAYYFGFTAPLLALVLGFAVDEAPRMLPVLAGLIIVSIATRMVPIVPSADFRSIVAAIRPRCHDCVIVVGVGSGRGVPGSVAYEAGNIPVLVLDSGIDRIVERARTFRGVYFIPSNEALTAPIELAFISKLRLQPASGYFTAVP